MRTLFRKGDALFRHGVAELDDHGNIRGFKTVLGKAERVDEIARLAIELPEPSDVELPQVLGYDQRYQIVSQAFFEQEQPTQPPGPIGKGMDGFEPVMKSGKLAEPRSALAFVGT